MRKKLKEHFASVCHSYPKCSLSCWIAYLCIQQLIFLAPMLKFLPKITPAYPFSFITSHLLLSLSFSHMCIGLSQFLFWPIVAVFGILLIVLLIGPFLPLIHTQSRIYEWVPLFCPLYILFSSMRISQSTSGVQQIICCIVIMLSSSLWLFQMVLLSPPYSHLNTRLSKLPDVLECLCFVLSCAFSLWKLEIALAIHSLLSILMFGMRMFLIGYLYEELEYVRVCGSVAQLMLCVTEVAQVAFGESLPDAIVAVVLLLVLFQRLGFVEVMFGRKYVRLLSKEVKFLKVHELVLTSNLLERYCVKLETKDNFYFYKFLMGSSMSKEIRRIKNTLTLCTFLEQKSKQSFELGVYVISKFIENGYYIKASVSGTYLNQLKKGFIDEIRLSTLNKILEENKSRINNFNLAESTLVCRLNPIAAESVDVETALKSQKLLQGLIIKILRCLQVINFMMKKLLAGSVTEGQAIKLLANIYKAKKDTEDNFKKHKIILKTYDGLMSYYLYLNVCKALKYTLMEELGDYFEAIYYLNLGRINMAPMNLICMVSGDNEDAGTILNANILTKQFFNMNEEKILHKAINISIIMPKCIAKQHDDFLKNFARSGWNNIIGRHRPGFCVQKGNIHKIDIYVKVTSFLNGLVFAGNMVPVKNYDSYALCDESWNIQECSTKIVQHFKWSPSGMPNIIEISKPIAKQIVKSNNISFDEENSKCVELRVNQKAFVAELYQFFSDKIKLNICKFLENTGYSQEFKSRYRLLDTQIRTYNGKCNNKMQQNEKTKRFYDIEYRIVNKKRQNNLLPCLRLGYILVWATATIGLILINSQLSLITSQTIEMVRLVKSSSPLLRCEQFEVVTAAMILAGIFKGTIPQTAGQRFGIQNLTEYMQSSSLNIVGSTLEIQQTMPIKASDYTLDFIDILRARIFKGFSTVKPYTQFDLQTELSNKKNMFFEIFAMNQSVFLASWPAIKGRIDFLQYYETFDNIKKVDGIIVDGTFKITDSLSKSVINQVIIFSVLVASATTMYFIVFSRMLSKLRIYIQLLKYLDASELRAKLAKNAYAENLLNTLKKQSIYSLNYESDNITMQIQGKSYVFKRGHILANEQEILKNVNSNAKQKRQITKQSQLWRELFGWLPMAIIMILSFAYFFQTISSCLKMSKSLSTFFTIDRSINLMQVTELAFFYIASSRFVLPGSPVIVFGLPADEVYDLMKYNLFHRDYQQILIYNPDWTNFTNNLYRSGCKPEDTLCTKLLSGAITGGWSSSIIQLTSSIQQLYGAVLNPNQTAQLRNYTMNLIIQVQFTYNQYIRPQIQLLKDFNYNMMAKALQDELDFRHDLMYFSIPVLMVVLGILLLGVLASSRRLQMVIRQMFSLDTIDFLYSNMHFSFQILRI